VLSGATTGVIGSGGAMPTNFSSAATGGFSYEVIGSGTELGLDYIDVKVSGTAGGSTAAVTPFRGFPAAATSGQNWTASFYVKLVGGSVTGFASINCTVEERDSTPTFVARTNTAFTPSSAYQRASSTRTMSASSADARLVLFTQVSANQTIDLTLRIAAPQLEQGAFATSYIPTTTAAATRAADSAVVTPISSFYNQAEGTLFCQYSRQDFAAAILQFDDNSNSNRWFFGTGTAGGPRINSTFTSNLNLGSAIQAGQLVKQIAVVDGAGIAAARDGVLYGPEAMTSAKPTITHLRIGRSASSNANCYIRKIAYWPKRLTNTLLEQLTT